MRPVSALLIVIAVLTAAVPAAPPSTQPAAEVSSRPAMAAPDVVDRATVTQVGLTIPGRMEPASYWLRRPAGHGPGQHPPLLICLHGTDDTARDMIGFWSDRTMRLPMVIAAPQGLGRGWRADDMPTVQAMLADLRERVPHDPRRLLLAGFSAGGAMSFELLYHERVPATAAVALASYVSPLLTIEEIRERRDVPVLYAVGMEDVNYDSMRAGVELLRSAGANVEVYRPRIGHTLDADVAQAALDWFFDLCAKQTATAIERAANESDPARAASDLERIARQAAWHEPAQAERAAEILARVEAPGRRDLAAARDLLAAGRAADAAEALGRIEQAYGGSRLAREARDLRERIEQDPRIRRELAERLAQRRADEALALYAGAQRLVAQKRFTEAAQRCRSILAIYGDTPAAGRAQYLLDLLESRSTP